MASSNQAVSLVQDVVGQDRHSRGTIAGCLVHLCRRLLDQVRTDTVAKRLIVNICQLNTFGNRHTIVRHRWTAVTLCNHDVATFWPHRHLYRVIERLCTTEDTAAGVIVIKYFLCHTHSSLA